MLGTRPYSSRNGCPTKGELLCRKLNPGVILPQCRAALHRGSLSLPSFPFPIHSISSRSVPMHFILSVSFYFAIPCPLDPVSIPYGIENELSRSRDKIEKESRRNQIQLSHSSTCFPCSPQRPTCPGAEPTTAGARAGWGRFFRQCCARLLEWWGHGK